MAGDYWRSTQAQHWLLSAYEIQLARLEDIRYAGSDEKLYTATIWLCNCISTLCKRLSLRQRVTATATVFFHRFYAVPPNAYCNTDPCLVATACVYVAAKVEETPLHVKVVMIEAGKLWKDCGHSGFPTSSSDLAEMEFYLVRDLNYHLILYHPYRTLIAISSTVGSAATEKSSAGKSLEAKVAAAARASGIDTQNNPLNVGSSALGDPNIDMVGNAVVDKRLILEEELARAAMTMGDHSMPIPRAAEIDDGVVQMAWFLINDTYRHASIHLQYPPYVIALSSIYLALVLREATREKMLASATRMAIRRGVSSNSTPQPDILTFLATLNIAPTDQLAACIQSILDGYAMWNRVHLEIEGQQGNLRVMRLLEEWRRGREEELRVSELRGAA